MKRWIRITLTVLTAAVGLSAMAGGVALIIGSMIPSASGGIVPDTAYLDGSPFTSFVGPGVLLAVVVGGTHILATVQVGRELPTGPLIAAIAGFGLLIWIFVQMMFVPFSVLQAVYFAAGLAELGLVLLGLGLFRRPRLRMS